MTKTILIVDDDTAILEMLKLYLTEQRYTIHITTSARMALNLLESCSVDLIITDIIMPEIEGIEFINELKRERNTARIIAMSGGDFSLNKSVYLDVAVAMGADAVISKPFKLENLLTLIQTLI